MRRVSHNNTDPKLYEEFNEFVGKIREFKMFKRRGRLIDVWYTSQDMNYIYADLLVDAKRVLHLVIDYRYRNNRFQINAQPIRIGKVPKKYIELAIKGIEEQTGWRRIDPEE